MQSLEVPFRVLLPELLDWYQSTPQSKAKTVELQEITSDYNWLIDRVNQFKGTQYENKSTTEIRLWIYGPGRQALPYLDEILCLQEAFGLDASMVANRLVRWVVQEYQPTVDFLEGSRCVDSI